MKIFTWNLNHRAKPRIINHAVSNVVSALSPDIVVFTEYVPGAHHQDFLSGLGMGGLQYSCMPPFAPKENHVLVVSRVIISEGSIRPPGIGPSVPSNFLHVRAIDDGFDILGLRVPDYSKDPPRRRACWDWIQEVAGSVAQHPFILIGDFNTAPHYQRSKCGDRLAELVNSGWQHAAPNNGGSYWSPQGHEVAIDHAFFTSHFNVKKARYIKDVNGTSLVGEAGALSDHAGLLAEFDLFSVQ
jgi:endonuclease/exonuclease/phosphatase family metal-dependent hydrolase